jgi:hypothetical protein
MQKALWGTSISIIECHLYHGNEFVDIGKIILYSIKFINLDTKMIVILDL